MFGGFLRRSWVFLSLSALVFAAGCGGASEYTVSGTVTLDGQPVEEGEIRFLPTDGQGTPFAGPIVNGKFESRASAGQNRVEINATRESATPAPDGLPNFESYIPAAYNSQSTLTVTIPPDSGSLTFDLKSDGSSP